MPDATIVNTKYEAAVDVDRLVEHPDNPRRGDLAAIVESIRANGFYGSLVVQTSTRHVCAGNHRLRAAREVGLDKVPVTWVDVDDATALRILAADNRTSDLAGRDDAALVALLGAIQSEGGLAGTGYVDDDLDDLLATLQEAAASPAGDGDPAPPPISNVAVEQDSSYEEFLERYRTSATRAIMLEYAIETHRWVVEALDRIGPTLPGAPEAHAEQVLAILEQLTGERAPTPPDPTPEDA